MKSIPEFPIAGVVPPEVRFIKIREVLEICGKSRSSVYAAVQKGEFPSPVKLSERSSAWVISEVLQWAQERIESSREDANLKRMKMVRRRAD
jgi:prophage regulatory protein